MMQPYGSSVRVISSLNNRPTTSSEALPSLIHEGNKFCLRVFPGKQIYLLRREGDASWSRFGNLEKANCSGNRYSRRAIQIIKTLDWRLAVFIWGRGQ